MRRFSVAFFVTVVALGGGCSDASDGGSTSTEVDAPDATIQPDVADVPDSNEPLPDAIGVDFGPPPVDNGTDPDTAGVPDGCCASSEDCPDGQSCVIATSAQAGEVLRICVPPATQTSDHPSACWMSSECEAGVPCVGAVVPGCGNPSGVTPKPGICIVDCCATDMDCLTDSAEVKVCAGSGANGLGECKGPGPEPGWCWGDAQCQPGEVCHGVKPCGCQAECKDEHAGVCVPADGVANGCAPIQEGWVKEWCDAANIVIFDGEKCTTTCPGCCECGPFCDLTFTSIEVCEAACKPSSCAVFDGACDDAIPDKPWYYWDGEACVEEDSCVCGACPGTYDTLTQCINSCVAQPDCPEYIGALKDCSYSLSTESGSSCPFAYCLNDRCDSDADCPAAGGGAKVGTSCVLGSCTYCWQDSQCMGAELCRAGRCVLPTKTDCPSPGACSDPGCKLVTQSEAPCPVCVCDGMGQLACEDDGQCQLISSFPYKHCVYGRCAECRMDSDCDFGACLPPGICFGMEPHPEAFYGTWVVGWGGGMDHFSYLRFEPDGTLRRGSYPEEGSLADDFPALPCWPDGVLPSPLLGTWQPEVTASGFLVLRLRINIGCDPAGGWTGRFVVNFADDGKTATLKDVDGEWSYEATKADASACTPDFSLCETPQLF